MEIRFLFFFFFVLQNLNHVEKIKSFSIQKNFRNLRTVKSSSIIDSPEKPVSVAINARSQNSIHRKRFKKNDNFFLSAFLLINFHLKNSFRKSIVRASIIDEKKYQNFNIKNQLK